jgi:LmbE family N-acetylglucosaminyl deacetylase
MFKHKSAEIYIPDGEEASAGLQRTTHLGIGAHQDDLEIMAIDGILRCFQQKDKWFCGTVVTNGSGSPRDDIYKDYSDAQMITVRVQEQKKAAYIGEYGSQVFLSHPSAVVKDKTNLDVIHDLVTLLRLTHPEIVYTHNLADKHNTHIAVALRVIEAIRSLPPEERPQKLYGCEVWRDLDWLGDDQKVVFDLSEHENLQAALVGVFDSQICGGKRYDLATMGRRRAHATYFESHGVDTNTGMGFAMDLTPLIENPQKSIQDLVTEHLDQFKQDVIDRISGSENI